MKKMIVLGLVAVVGASLLAPAQAAKPKSQKVEGTIFMTPPFVTTTEQLKSCYAGVHRRLIIAGAPANGLTGYAFDLEPGTVGGKFKLDASGGQGYIDLDITFYNDFGSIQDHADNPPWGTDPVTVAYATREAGGETGTVPPGMKKAIICSYVGDGGVGFGANFSYNAVGPKKKK